MEVERYRRREEIYDQNLLRLQLENEYLAGENKRLRKFLNMPEGGEFEIHMVIKK